MNIRLVIFSVLVLFFLVGCSQVVYRVSSDTPLKMDTQQAKDIIKSKLLTMEKNVRMEDLTFDGDFRFSLYHNTAVSSLSDVVLEVEKVGDYYSVFLNSTLIRQTLSWKSESDARQFVDAVYFLLKNKKGG